MKHVGNAGRLTYRYNSGETWTLKLNYTRKARHCTCRCKTVGQVKSNITAQPEEIPPVSADPCTTKVYFKFAKLHCKVTADAEDPNADIEVIWTWLTG